jgi:hypothetical protein
MIISFSQLSLVLSAASPAVEERQELWPMYAEILSEQDTFKDDCRPTLAHEDDPLLEQWAETSGKYR